MEYVCLKRTIISKNLNKGLVSSPTMHDPESMKYVKEAYETNWMSTVGANINEVEKVAAEYIRIQNTQ